jgi:peptidoglycan/xylan/chitin deacetylase (PgdA/CDA1 family)
MIRRNLCLLLFALTLFSSCARVPSEKLPPRARAIPVIMYHEITAAKPAGLTVLSPERFRDQMQFLAENGYTTITTQDLLDFLNGKPLPEKSILLTFDDGWKSQAIALPILKQHNFKATFFIITGAADGTFGNDYLTWNEIETLSQNPNVDIQSHSITHPWKFTDNFITWARNSPKGKSLADIQHELTHSKKILESKFQKPINFFAWPCGWTTPELTAEAQAAGYQAQFTTIEEHNTPGTNPHQLRRYFVDGNWSLHTFQQLLDNQFKFPRAAQPK